MSKKSTISFEGSPEIIEYLAEASKMFRMSKSALLREIILDAKRRNIEVKTTTIVSCSESEFERAS